MLLGTVRRAALLAAVTVGILSLVGAATPALASSAVGAVTTTASAQSTVIATFTFTRTSTNLDGGDPTEALPQPAFIICEARAVAPTISPFSNSVFFTTKGTCTSPVAKIEIQFIQLLRNNVIQQVAVLNPPATNTAFAQKSTPLAQCFPGTWTGRSEFVFTMPAGYTPPVLEFKPSESALINC